MPCPDACRCGINHLEPLKNAADEQHRVVDLADLEDVPAAGNEVADVHRSVLAGEVPDRLAVLVDELVPEEFGLALHARDTIAAA
jgi:hypothetical protein